MTLQECVSRAAALLAGAGFTAGDARRDAGVLARFILGWSLADWAARSRESAPAGFETRFDEAVARRTRHEPVAYITESREFYGRSFRVTPATLIPRPETEGLIEEALKIAGSARFSDSTGLVVDVGTGTGCLAITLALEIAGARVVATDVSAAALEVARSNAAVLGCSRIEFHQLSGDDFLPRGLPPAGLIISNPPYVPERDRTSLPPDVRDYEPGTALFAGEDGLDVIRGLVPAAATALAPGGSLVMEIGAGQAEAAARMVVDAGLELTGIRPDLQGIPRIVVALRRA